MVELTKKFQTTFIQPLKIKVIITDKSLTVQTSRLNNPHAKRISGIIFPYVYLSLQKIIIRIVRNALEYG